VLQKIMLEHGSVVFNGNGYAEAWQIEAAERGLPNLRTTLDAVPELVTPAAIELFEHYKVFNEREMHSRFEIALEQYILSISVEAKLTLEMGYTMVLPAAVRYQTELALNVGALLAAGVETDTSTLEPISGLINSLRASLSELSDALKSAHSEEIVDEAKYAQEALLPALTAVRTAADALEGMVADDLWPLPTYQEMLHIL
jgi:glutamine synthetase